MELRRTFGVATGQARYPTPLGRFEIVVKWRNPWWYPPASDWAKDAKPIPPGPGNPLGTRWMGISSPAVGIHGTPDAASIGYSASHGCIRMLISEVEWLFEQVETGTPGLHRRSDGPRSASARQVVAVGVVVALLGLLIWKVAKGDDNAVTGSLADGQARRSAWLHARQARRRRRPRPRVPAREGGRAQLLGLLVRAVQGRDAAPAAGLGALAGQGRGLRAGST